MVGAGSIVSSGGGVASGRRRTVSDVVFWVLLLIVTPLLLDPRLIWATSLAPLRATALFKGAAAWAVLLIGVLIVVSGRTDVTAAKVLRSLPRVALPFKLLWAFIVLVLVSTLFSNLAPSVPALGSVARADGTLLQVAWFGMALVSAELARTAVFRPRRWLRYFCWGGVATAVWVLLQVRGHDPLTMLSQAHFYLKSPGGAFGHGSIASAYLAICLVVTISAWVREARRGLLHVLAVVLVAAGMVAAGGRAAVVGSLVSGIVLAADALQKPNTRRNLFVLAVAVVVGAAAGFAASPRTQQKLNVTATGLEGKGWGISVRQRLVVWRVATRVIGAHPWFGVGPEGFGYALWAQASPSEQATLLSTMIGVAPAPGTYTIAGNAIVFKDPKTGRTVARQLTWDKAHDYFLDVALATGLPSMVLFLAFLVVTLALLLGSPSILARSIGLGLLTFTVWSLAWFYTVSLDPLVWGMAGAGLGMHWKSLGDRRSRGAHDAAD